MTNDNIIRQIYEKLESEVIRSLKTDKDKSILIPLIKANSNNVFDVFTNSAIEVDALSDEFITWAVKNRFLRHMNEVVSQKEMMVLTIQGIWHYESKIGKMSTDMLLDSLQTLKFQFTISSEPLNDKEIISLIFLIAFRIFSKQVAINTTTARKCDMYQEAIEEIEKYCINIGLVKKGFFGPANFGLEHPISYIMRRLNDLPKKTNNIFCAKGEKLYYLDVAGDEEKSGQKLVFLWRKIIPQGFSVDNIFRLFVFIDELAKNLMVSVCDSYDYYDSTWNNITDNCKYRIKD